eukprot:TRINITY_DN5061_c1_g2_i1.p1 TRINITY_DN5061_c1_g2~~TRINITY_DN5061_c1_g2_i1.p1  ORF type:complete len:404 (+),score=136.81 TRINITY_DN5061_c1_g2_i1:81-1292(+)
MQALELHVVRSGCSDALVAPRLPCSVGSFRARVLDELELDARWEWDVSKEDAGAMEVALEDSSPLEDALGDGDLFAPARVRLRPKGRHLARARLRKHCAAAAELVDSLAEGAEAAGGGDDAPLSPRRQGRLGELLGGCDARTLELVVAADVLRACDYTALCCRWGGDGDHLALARLCHAAAAAAEDGGGGAPPPRAFLNASAAAVVTPTTLPQMRPFSPAAPPPADAAAAPRTPLMHAAAAGHAAAARALLDAGADVNAAVDGGATALWCAAGAGRGAVCELLMVHPAFDPAALRATVGGETCLMRAVAKGDGGAARALLEGGAAVDAPSAPAGWSPLFAAVYAARRDLCDLLLAHGADPNCRAADGTAPGDYLPQGGVGDGIRDALRAHGALDGAGAWCPVQ